MDKEHEALCKDDNNCFMQIGKTKVFLRVGQMAELDAHRNEVLGRSACTIQRKYHSYFTRKTFLLLRDSAIETQAICRGQLARSFYEWMRRDKASLVIGKFARMFLSKKAYKLLWSSAVFIQTGLRGMAAHNELNYRRKRKAAITIQSHFRGFLDHIYYKRMKKAAITAQCAWRVRVARRELRILKMAAKEAAVLQAANSMLEKKVEELSSQLELEKRMRADIEEAKTEENAKLQSALDEIRHQLQETKELFMREHEKANKSAEILEARNEEHVKLQCALDEMRLQLHETKELLMREKEKANETAEIEGAKTEQQVKLQSDLEEIRLQFQETKESLMREQEKAKETADLVEVRSEEHEKLQFTLEETRLKFQETKELLLREREKTKETVEENAKLQSALEEMRLHIQETKELLLREQEKAKETADKEQAKTEENVKLQSALEEMRLQFEETKELLMKERQRKESAETVSVVQESQVIDHEMVNKLVTENEQLKASEEAITRENARLESALEEMKLHLLQETKASHRMEHETPNRTAEEMPVVQNVQLINEEKVNELTSENESPKEKPKTQENAKLQSALEGMQLQLQDTNELLLKVHEPVEKIADQLHTAHETQKIFVEKVSAVQEVKLIDHETVNKLMDENLQLKALVSSLEKKINETVKKYKETTKLGEERLKQVMDAESKIIELKIDMQRLKEKLSDIETEDHILRQQKVLNSQSKRMSGRFTIGNQPSDNGHQVSKRIHKH
ncbi:unnamed protein product [Cuscuta europaea]|uniref:Myosin motor domain-containing protein n=1 Tax=Cuscuta europaea TaxID=41803 RepID=A0A9P0YQT7_CUSEU|nr:unnamed protein product [Cuscuta europaea]